MTTDEHTAAQATRSIESGISDLLEMFGAGYIDEVDAEYFELAMCMMNLGNLIHSLAAVKNRKVA